MHRSKATIFKTSLLVSMLFVCFFLNGQNRTTEQRFGKFVIEKEVSNVWQMPKSSYKGIQIQSNLGQITETSLLKVQEYGEFLRIGIDDYISGGKIGDPALPVQVKIIEIPQGATPVVKILSDKTRIIPVSSLGKDLPIYPVQPPIKKSAKDFPSFVYNVNEYNAKGYLPSEIVKIEILGESRGVRLARLVISPIEYNPSEGLLKVHTQLKFEVIFKDADKGSTINKKSLYHSEAFGGIESYGVNSQSLKNDSKAIKIGGSPMKYVIVSDPKFRDSLSVFVKWKTTQGFNVVEAYTSDANVGNTNTSIKTYLQGLYDNASDANPAPSYILIVGDNLDVPPFKSRCTGPADFKNHITDFYYSEFTNDNLPDVFIGRFSADMVSELMPQIYKTIQMSQVNPLKASFMDTTLLIAGNDSRFGNSHLNPQLKYTKKHYANSDNGIVSFLYEYPSSSQSEKRKDIIKNISSGANIIVYTGHGYDEEWSDPLISSSTIKNEIFNKDKYPLMIGNCCLSGKFNSTRPCFGEVLLRSKNKGAVAYIGATNSTYFDEDFYWSVGLSNIGSVSEYTYENTGKGAMDCFFHTHGEKFSDWAQTASEIIFRGNMAVTEAGGDMPLYYWEVYELFGDPSYMPKKNKPSYAKMESDDVFIMGTNVLEVKTEPFAQGALSIDGRLLSAACADTNGELSINAEYAEIGNVTLYVSSQFKTDAIKTINVITPQGKYASASNIKFFDAEKETTLLDFGKTYKVSLRLDNLGTEALKKVKISIISSDPYFVEKDSYLHPSSIEVGGKVELDKVLSFSIDPNIPDGHIIEYSIKSVLEDNEANPILKKGKLTVGAPELEWVSFVIDDSHATTPNKVLDAGETATVAVSWKNVGSRPIKNLKISYSSDKAYVKVPDGEAEGRNMEPNDTIVHKFEVKALDWDQRYTMYTITLDAKNEGRSQKMNFTSYVGPVIETFETGNFEFVKWNAASDWVISNRAHGGLKSAASANIKDSEKSKLTIKTQQEIDDYVGFYYKTSTEKTNDIFGDFLQFYIDDTLVGEWAGENDWTYFERPIPSGEHTISWVYTKDDSNKEGEDKVWIDDVRLPIGAHPAIVSNECSDAKMSDQKMLFSVIGSANKELNLLFNTDKDIKGNLYIIDVMGKNVLNLSSALRIEEGKNKLVFNVSELKAGMYVCVFENQKGQYSVKFIKNK